jgi:hypothetical protein
MQNDTELPLAKASYGSARIAWRMVSNYSFRLILSFGGLNLFLSFFITASTPIPHGTRTVQVFGD